MPTVHKISNQDDLIELVEKVRSLLDKVGSLNVAYSSNELKCTDYAKERSLPQNSLCHVWLTDACAFFYGKKRKAVTKSDLKGMKRFMKLKCYLDCKQDWLVEYLRNPEDKAMKLDATSMADWNMGQTHFFMEWMLQYWGERNLVLECIGEFKELSDKQNA